MEKLSIEEKAKAYDEALERVEKIRTGKYETTFIFTEGLFEHIFPELKESEGERLRKEIIAYLKQKETCYSGPTAFNSWITWLEKQSKTYNSIKWHNSSEEPEENREILCVCADSKGFTWHEIALYYAYNKTFCDGELLVENITRWCYIDDLEKQGEKKTAIEAWKEMRLEVYAQASGNRHEPNCSDDKTKMFSLSDIDEIIEKISNQKPADVNDIIGHLKSIKDKYSWKPSEEQMDALETAVSSLQSTALESLYNELKKL